MIYSSQASMVVGVIALAVGGYLISFGNHRISSIWILFTGIVFTALSGALYLHAEALPIPESATTKPKKKRDLTQPIQNNTIKSINQTAGFTGINNGTLIQGPPPPVPITLSEAHISRLKEKLASLPIATAKFLRYDDPSSEALCNQLMNAFGRARIPNLDIFGSYFPAFAPGVTVRYANEEQSLQTDAMLAALLDAGIPCRKTQCAAETRTIEIAVNGLQ